MLGILHGLLQVHRQVSCGIPACGPLTCLDSETSKSLRTERCLLVPVSQVCSEEVVQDAELEIVNGGSEQIGSTRGGGASLA